MRQIGVLTLIASFFVFQGSRTSGQQPNPNTGPRSLTVQSSDIAALRSWDAWVTDAARTGTLRLHSQTIDPMVPARTVERYDQFYQGIRIWGADVVRDSERGVPMSLFGEVVPDLTFSIQPALTPAAAAETLTRLGGTDATLLTAPELVVLPLPGGDYRLAYTAAVYGADDVFRAFVDAQSGRQLRRYTEIQRDAAVGTGTGVLGDRKKLSVDTSAGVFLAFDRARPPVIQTFDLRNNLTRFKLLERGLLPYTTADLATDSDNVWTDPAVVDAHAHVSWTYDYYFKRFGRTGLDGRNGPINIAVNAVSQQAALTLSPFDQVYAINAFWCNACGPNGQGRIFFGNGVPPGIDIGNGRNYSYFAGGLDIAAHELTHGLTAATSNLIYEKDSGALNEAFSDIMGKGAEFFYHPAGSNVGQADYVLGKDIARSVRPGVPSGDRSMANPGLFGYPDHYSRRYTDDGDGGGVHINSGVASHAFYLAIESGVNRTSGLAVQGVGAGNRDQIEKVFFRAFTTLLPSSATFLTARAATTQAARDLYGAGSAPERAVTQAWTAVGVPDPAAVTTLTGAVVPDGLSTFTVTATSNGRLEATLTWNSTAANDLDLYLTREGCPVTQAGCVLAQSITGFTSESVTWPVRTGERYSFTVHNFSGNAASFVLQNWFTAGIN